MSASLLPRPSTGVVEAPLGAGLVVFEPRRTEVHVLNQTAALVWQACAAGLGRVEAVDVLAQRTGASTATVAADLDGLVLDLAARGVVGIADPPAPLVVRIEPPSGAEAVVVSVLDRSIALEVADADLRRSVAAAFADLRSDRPPDRRLVVDRATDGYRLHGGGHDATHPTLSTLLDALASQLNRVAATCASLLALHAAALCSPEGAVVVLVGRSGAGKSTAAAALVAAGWDYLTDEAVGIAGADGPVLGYPKPLALDAHSRGLLGLAPAAGELVCSRSLRPSVSTIDRVEGPVAAVAVVDRGGIGAGAPLAPSEAVVELAGHALNLHAAGAAGLGTLAQLAGQVPVCLLGTADLVSMPSDMGRLAHLR